MNFQTGDLIITKDYGKGCKKRVATIIQVHEPEYSDIWNGASSITYQYCDDKSICRENLKYFVYHFLSTICTRERWFHIPVKN
jgi:hypothetical protein